MSHEDLPYDEILRRIISGIVIHKRNLEINLEHEDARYRVQITTNAADHGKILGHHGQNIDAFQALAEAIASGRRQRVCVSLNRPKVGNPLMSGLPFEEDENWNRDPELAKLVSTVVGQICVDPVQVHVQPMGRQSLVRIDTIEIGRNLEASLRLIFKAWGKANGRRLLITVGPKHASEIL